jgi:LysM repeat protein
VTNCFIVTFLRTYKISNASILVGDPSIPSNSNGKQTRNTLLSLISLRVAALQKQVAELTEKSKVKNGTVTAKLEQRDIVSVGSLKRDT